MPDAAFGPAPVGSAVCLVCCSQSGLLSSTGRWVQAR